MKVEYQLLIEKQEREMQCFEANEQRKLKSIEAERERRLKANENLKNQLNSKIKGPKQPRHPSVVASQVVSRDQRTPMTGVMTARTRSQFANYRKAAESTRLDVKLGNIKKVMKPLTPSPHKQRKKTRKLNVI